MSLSSPSSLLFASCRVFQGEPIRSCRWARVPPLQRESRLLQCCQRSRSFNATKQRTSRYERVKRAPATNTSLLRSQGTLHHLLTRQGLFRYVKEFSRPGLVSCNHGLSTNIYKVALICTSHSSAWEAATGLSRMKLYEGWRRLVGSEQILWASWDSLAYYYFFLSIMKTLVSCN